MALSKEVKLHLMKVFGIVRTGVTEIRDTTLVSDGFTTEDLMAITLDKMNAYIGSTETFPRAWELTLAKIHSELHPPLGEIIGAPDGSMTIAPIPEEITPIVEEVPVTVVPEFEPEALTPWCDTCDSLGVRHKKTCPKYVEIPTRAASSAEHVL